VAAVAAAASDEAERVLGISAQPPWRVAGPPGSPSAPPAQPPPAGHLPALRVAFANRLPPLPRDDPPALGARW
jgi:hypothetical protein